MSYLHPRAAGRPLGSRRRRAIRPASFRPRVEWLEGRQAPSVTPGPPAIILATAGTPQTDVMAGTAAPIAFQALVEDASGNPVGAGVEVTFIAWDGSFVGGDPNQPYIVTVPTDASGTATAPTFVAGPAIGVPASVTASVAGVDNPAAFSVTIVPGAPALVMAGSGTTPQFATPGTPFSTVLQVTVTDSLQDLVGAGVNVTFTAPASGAGGTFAGGATSVTVATDAGSVATAPPFTANGTAGSYVVTASVAGGSSAASFDLQNLAPDAVITNIVSPDTVGLSSGGAGAVVLTDSLYDPAGGGG